MLLRGLTWLVLFQLLGTAINHLFLPVLPGPIVGLLLLLGYLVMPRPGRRAAEPGRQQPAALPAVVAGAARAWG